MRLSFVQNCLPNEIHSRSNNDERRTTNEFVVFRKTPNSEIRSRELNVFTTINQSVHVFRTRIFAKTTNCTWPNEIFKKANNSFWGFSGSRLFRKFFLWSEKSEIKLFFVYFINILSLRAYKSICMNHGTNIRNKVVFTLASETTFFRSFCFSNQTSCWNITLALFVQFVTFLKKITKRRPGKKFEKCRSKFCWAKILFRWQR